MITGYVLDGFDMLHVGHLNILAEAVKRCDHLIAGVATDESLERMKGRDPIVPLAERMAMVVTLHMVDSVVPDCDQDKRPAWERSPFDMLFKGTDWEGTNKDRRPGAEMAEVGASVIYLPYIPTTSSTVPRRTLIQEVASRSPQGAKRPLHVTTSGRPTSRRAASTPPQPPSMPVTAETTDPTPAPFRPNRPPRTVPVCSPVPPAPCAPGGAAGPPGPTTSRMSTRV